MDDFETTGAHSSPSTHPFSPRPEGTPTHTPTPTHDHRHERRGNRRNGDNQAAGTGGLEPLKEGTPQLPLTLPDTADATRVPLPPGGVETVVPPLPRTVVSRAPERSGDGDEGPQSPTTPPVLPTRSTPGGKTVKDRTATGPTHGSPSTLLPTHSCPSTLLPTHGSPSTLLTGLGLRSVPETEEEDPDPPSRTSGPKRPHPLRQPRRGPGGRHLSVRTDVRSTGSGKRSGEGRPFPVTQSLPGAERTQKTLPEPPC